MKLPLHTERFVLTQPGAADADALRAYELRNRQHFAASSPLRDDEWFSVAAVCRRIDAQQAANVQDIAHHWIVRQSVTGDIIGHAALTGIMRGAFHAAYLGYGIDAAHCGRGLATEVLGGVVGHGFDALGLHRIMANHVPENEASARVLGKLGFEREGFARGYLHLDGHWRDHMLTALINREWRAG